MLPPAKVIISSPVIRADKANSDINNKKFISLLYSTNWGCIYHENIQESHLNEYGLHINRAGSINLAKNIIPGIRKFWYDLDTKNKKKKFSPAPRIRNSVQLELDSSFKSDSIKSSVGQPDDYMLRLRKLRIIIIIIIIIIFISSWCKIVKILIKISHPVDTTIASTLLSTQKKM